jgi:hypothetical protein
MKPWAKAAVQGAACGLVLGVVLLIGGRLWQPRVAVAQARQPAMPDVVQAGRFEVVDAAGRVRATLGVSAEEGKARLVLFDAAGKGDAWLEVSPHGSPSLMLFDPIGMGHAALEAVLPGNPNLTLSDAAGQRAVLTVLPNGIPRLVLFDAAEKQRAALEVRPDGSPNLELYDAAWKSRVHLGMQKDGKPSLELADKAGNLRATLGATSLETVKTAEVRMRPESCWCCSTKTGRYSGKLPSRKMAQISRTEAVGEIFRGTGGQLYSFSSRGSLGNLPCGCAKSGQELIHVPEPILAERANQEMLLEWLDPGRRQGSHGALLYRLFREVLTGHHGRSLWRKVLV